jgi:hypothetical protein
MAFEEKVSDATMIESLEALKMAKEIFEKNKGHVEAKPQQKR